MFLIDFNGNPMQKLTMGEIVYVGLCHLQTLVGTCEQFISVFWNVFLLAVFVSLYGTAPWSITVSQGTLP